MEDCRACGGWRGLEVQWGRGCVRADGRGLSGGAGGHEGGGLQWRRGGESCLSPAGACNPLLKHCGPSDAVWGLVAGNLACG